MRARQRQRQDLSLIADQHDRRRLIDGHAVARQAADSVVPSPCAVASGFARGRPPWLARQPSVSAPAAQPTTRRRNVRRSRAVVSAERLTACTVASQKHSLVACHPTFGSAVPSSVVRNHRARLIADASCSRRNPRGPPTA